MTRNLLIAFYKDESASVAMEYLLLASILGIGWIAAGTEYRDKLVELFANVSRALSQIKL